MEIYLLPETTWNFAFFRLLWTPESRSLASARCSGIKCRPWWKSVSGYPIPDRTGISYRTPAAFYYNIPCHRVNITENTLLHSICHGETQIAVNSSHHQCVHIPAPGLVVSAVAPDGIIEAVEKPDYISSWECSGIRNISGTEMRLLWDCFRHLWMRVNNIWFCTLRN